MDIALVQKPNLARALARSVAELNSVAVT